MKNLGSDITQKVSDVTIYEFEKQKLGA